MSIQHSHIVNSINGCGVFCSSLNSVQCTREGSAKDFTTLQCPIVYPQRGSESITVSTDESELIGTVSLELQGDIEDSCEVQQQDIMSNAQERATTGSYKTSD